MSRITTTLLQEKKAKKEKITMLTSYDYSTAVMVDKAGIDCILVGDSLGNVILGYEDTLPVTMDDMIHHTRAVSRGARNSLVVETYLFFHTTYPSGSHSQCGAFHPGRWSPGGETGRRGRKGRHHQSHSGCPDAVMGHIGLTPQSVHQFGASRFRKRPGNC